MTSDERSYMKLFEKVLDLLAADMKRLREELAEAKGALAEARAKHNAAEDNADE